MGVFGVILVDVGQARCLRDVAYRQGVRFELIDKAGVAAAFAPFASPAGGLRDKDYCNVHHAGAFERFTQIPLCLTQLYSHRRDLKR